MNSQNSFNSQAGSLDHLQASQSILIILSLPLYGLRGLCQALHLKPFGSLQERWELFLRDVNFTSVHEFQDGLKVAERNVFQNDNGMLRWIFLKESFKVRTACWKNHLMCFTCLPFTCQSNICKTLLISQVFERWHHVWLEIVPFQEELLLFVCHDESEWNNYEKELYKSPL